MQDGIGYLHNFTNVDKILCITAGYSAEHEALVESEFGRKSWHFPQSLLFERNSNSLEYHALAFQHLIHK